MKIGRLLLLGAVIGGATFATMASGRPAKPPCTRVEVVVHGADLRTAGNIMVDAVSDEGQKRLRRALRASPRSVRFPILRGRSVFGVADDLVVAPDLCFNHSECSEIPVRGPGMVVGCQPRNCSARAAVLEKAGVLLATVTTDFAGQSALKPSGPDAALFISGKGYSRDYLRRMAASWYVLHRDFVREGAVSNEPDLSALDHVKPNAIFHALLLECAAS